jgi:hypothetical protein
VDIACDTGERDLMMEMSRRGDRHGIDTLRQQFVEVRERAASGELGGARAVLRQRIDDTDQRDVG